MRPAPGIQRRLGIGLAAGVLAMWLAATVASGFVVRHELDEAFDSALQETAQRLLPLAVEDILDREGEPTARRVAAVAAHKEFLTYVVRDRDANVLLHSRDAEPDRFPKTPARGFRDTPTHRIYGESAVSDTIFIEVAEPLEHRREAALEATLGLLSPLPLLIPLSVFGVWWFVRRSLRPVLSLREQIETRGGGDLTPLAGDELPPEIGPIADAVNRLMERVRAALEAERNFTANSAHELRTPIAGALAQTQRLVAEAPEGPLRGHGRRVEASLHHLARLSEKLMQLAKAEAKRFGADELQDLGAVLGLVVDEFRREGEGGATIRFAADGPEGLRALMDADAFAILMRNLIENAVKHGTPSTPVDVFVDGTGAVHVVNGGPIVDPETLARVKGRFERGPTQASGSGLGLAIVEAIAQGSGARVDLRSPATGKPDGFEATVTMPPRA